MAITLEELIREISLQVDHTRNMDLMTIIYRIEKLRGILFQWWFCQGMLNHSSRISMRILSMWRQLEFQHKISHEILYLDIRDHSVYFWGLFWALWMRVFSASRVISAVIIKCTTWSADFLEAFLPTSFCVDLVEFSKVAALANSDEYHLSDRVEYLDYFISFNGAILWIVSGSTV